MLIQHLFRSKMRKLLFILSLLTLLKMSNQTDDERINEGASTSRQDLTRCENCELEICATRTVFIMLAEDTRGDNPTDLINNRFEELEAFSDEIFSYVMLARYGTTDLSNTQRQERRINYFLIQFRREIL